GRARRCAGWRGGDGVASGGRGSPAARASVGPGVGRSLAAELSLRRAGGWDTISKKRSPGEAPPRIIAATHPDLERLIAAGRFRTDRYYRLKVFTIALPPLRDRREDIPLLIHHYLRRLGCEL